jgi:hypothetical protein
VRRRSVGDRGGLGGFWTWRFFPMFCSEVREYQGKQITKNLYHRHPKTRRFMSRQHHLLVVIGSDFF